MKTVIVTWMDRTQQTYHPESVAEINGATIIRYRRNVVNGKVETYKIPHDNVKVILTEED